MTSQQSQFEVYDKKFNDILADDSQLVELAGDMEFLEGPVWVNASGALIFSDIPADEMKIWSPERGLDTFRKPSGQANGNTLDLKGRLLTCEHDTRRLTRTQADGTVTVLADSYQSKPLNSPNDVVVRFDGSIWFTDPPYGIKPEQIAQDHNYVFRLDESSGRLEAVASDFDMPNGLCFSPDGGRLYIADSGRDRHHIRFFDVTDSGRLEGGSVLATIATGVPDGIRTDLAGRIYSTAGDGIWVIDANGYLLGKILVPQTPANCTFGGPQRDTLYITARTSLYSIRLDTVGAQSP